MRYLEVLIDEARALSGNTRYDSDSGVSQRLFRQYFQNAQDFLVMEIINSKSKYQMAKETVTIVSGQSEYDYPSDIILQGIDSIQYSTDGVNWGRPLVKNISGDRRRVSSGSAYGYTLNRDNYELTPPIATGYLLLSYNRRPKRLEKRSAKVVSTTGTPITSITIDTSYSQHDPTYIDLFDSVTIVGKNGVVKVANMPITAASGSTITVDSYTLANGEAVAAGDYVLAGGDAVNIPEFDDIAESFLILHVNYQAKFGDASKWTSEAKEAVGGHAAKLVQMFNTVSEDIVQVPIINADYLEF